MAPKHRCRELAFCASAPLFFIGCSWLPPDNPATQPAVDPDAALLHPWKITGHVVGPHALISDYDAAGFHRRTIAITATTYASPWSGTCNEAARAKSLRPLAEVASEHSLAADRTAQLGLADPVVEYKLTCGLGRTLPLTVYLAGAHALTCWSGVCYVLAH